MRPILAITFVFLSIGLFSFIKNDKQRVMVYNGKKVTTTFDAEEKFIGLYKGNKSGFLLLNADGTGQYNYDVFGFAAEGCKKDTIAIEWGFMVGKDGKLLKFEREYGFSYPILFKSTSATKFKGCREEVLLDFVMEYKDGTLGISSSDNWKKNNN